MKRIFHFIACSNNTLLMDECRRYIDRLFVPEGWRIEVTVITDAKSMCEGYNRAAVMHPDDPPRTEDVPVRIYLHQDVYLINRFFLHNLLMILQSHPDIGLIGMAGTPQMHPSGVWWNGEGVGCLYTVTDDPLTEEEYTSAPALTEVASVDGFCMVTRADIPWREDLFDGFDFYDVSLCYEMRRAGLRVVVPDMRHPWCVHDDGRVLSLYHYNHYRKIFLEAYGQKEDFNVCTDHDSVKEQLHGPRDLISSLDESLRQIRESLGAKKKEILFLPCKASCWNSMESLWKAVNEDPDYEATVMPVPWRYRDELLNPRDTLQYERELFPDYVPTVDYHDYSIAESYPHAIVIHNPYDECNYATTVEPNYYARILKKCTRNLIYIPWFVTDEIDYDSDENNKMLFNMRYYVTVPGVVHSDLVIVQSEQMRHAYIEILTGMSGEDRRSVWEEKVRGYGSPLFDRRNGEGYEEIPVSPLWQRIKEDLK